MEKATGLRLVKWYADAVAPDGSGFVAYHVELSFRALHVRLGSVMTIPREGPAVTSTFRARAAPRLEESVLCWPGSRTLAPARFVPRSSPHETTLLSRGGRSLSWCCVAAAASVTVGGRDAGLGYAERIETTLAPWNLPIRELRWGRFVAPGAALAWIDWGGPHPLRLVLHDGHVSEHAAVDDAHVTTRTSLLSLALPRVLREGPLGTTALARVPLVRDALPARLLAISETKWISRGTLVDLHGRHEGWALHEVVRWP